MSGEHHSLQQLFFKGNTSNLVSPLCSWMSASASKQNIQIPDCIYIQRKQSTRLYVTLYSKRYVRGGPGVCVWQLSSRQHAKPPLSGLPLHGPVSTPTFGRRVAAKPISGKAFHPRNAIGDSLTLHG